MIDEGKSRYSAAHALMFMTAAAASLGMPMALLKKLWMGDASPRVSVKPHEGPREIERRRRQIEGGVLCVSWHQSPDVWRDHPERTGASWS